MKRSEINRYVSEAISFFQEHRFCLPPFAFFDKKTWADRRAQAQEIFDLQLGWDVTSFGTNDFLNTGLLLFTLRNGRTGSSQYPKPYAEKIMMVRVAQVTPCHFHWRKREDIINRGGGNLVMEVWKAGQDNRITDASFEITLDGLRRAFQPGERLVLQPGESVCFEPYVAHRFYGEKETVVVGEVSMVNDVALGRKYGAEEPFVTPGRFTPFALQLVARMLSPLLRDRVSRLIRDPARKLGWNDRMVGAIRLCLEQGVEPLSLYRATARACRRWLGSTSLSAQLKSLWPDAAPAESARLIECICREA